MAVDNPPKGLAALSESNQSLIGQGTKVEIGGFPAPFGRLLPFETAATRNGRDLILSQQTQGGYSGGPVLRDGLVVGMVYGRVAGLGAALESGGLRGFLEGNSLAWNRGSNAEGRRTNAKDGLTYVWIAPGEFQMGCSLGERYCYDNVEPSHTVRISNGYWLGESEVTQAAYQKVIGSNPSHFKGPDLPVEQVSATEADQYCRVVGGRLPTEAEWEYAVRAGDKSARYGDVDAIGWHKDNSGEKTHQVKTRNPNAWGLYDMLGNVWEWVSDRFDWYYYRSMPGLAIDPGGPAAGSLRVIRGGGWEIILLTASFRIGIEPGTQNNTIGFRCVWKVSP